MKLRKGRAVLTAEQAKRLNSWTASAVMHEPGVEHIDDGEADVVTSANAYEVLSARIRDAYRLPAKRR